MRKSSAFWALATGILALGAGVGATMEVNQARPGGVFLTTPASSPQACARTCENDSLCMAWTHTLTPKPQCELKAVIPAARYVEGATSGLSSRAPRLMRLVPAAEPPGPPAQIAAIASVDALRREPQDRVPLETQPATTNSVQAVPPTAEVAPPPRLQSETAAEAQPQVAVSRPDVQNLQSPSMELPSVGLGEPVAPDFPRPIGGPAPAVANPTETNQPPAQPRRARLNMGR